MIVFYRKAECEGCEAIQETLENLTLAHRVVVTEGEELPDDVPEDASMPVLVDDGKVYAGREKVLEHLNELESFKDLWYKFQSDACYCEDDGGIA